MSESVPPPSEPDPIPFAPDVPPVNPPPPMYTPAAPTPPVNYASGIPGAISPANKDDQTMGMLAHLLGIFTFFIGPLIIWLLKKDQSKYIDEQSKEALNFQIAASIVLLGCLFLVWIPFVNCLVLLLIVGIHIARLVMSIIGTVAASKGEMYRYPVTFRLIK